VTVAASTMDVLNLGEPGRSSPSAPLSSGHARSPGTSMTVQEKQPRAAPPRTWHDGLDVGEESRVEVVLVPGLWLDASSWHEVATRLRAVGHSVHTLTLRGLESRNADRSGIMMADHVAEIATAVEQCGGPVALVGHGESGGLVHAVVNRVPDRVARAIYVGGFPSADGTQVLSGFTIEALLGSTGDDDRATEDAALKALVRRASETSARVLDAVQRVANPRRFDVPVTVIATEFSAEDVRRWMAHDVDPARELARMSTIEFVDLPAGHWPHMERVDDLVDVLLPRLHAPVIA